MEILQIYVEKCATHLQKIKNCQFMIDIKKSFYYAVFRWRIAREMRKKYLKPAYKSDVSSLEDSSNVIKSILSKDTPSMICRWGSLELIIVTNILSVRYHLRMRPSARRVYNLCKIAGFFPNNPLLMYRFTDLMLESFSEADCVGVWNDSIELPLEDYIINKYAPCAGLVPLICVSPEFMQVPWSSILRGKKVLVVSPFIESIKKQYARRELLFSDADVRLPEFELKTLKAVQSLAWAKTDFDTWFDALEHMRRQMEEIDFDIALIGAGAYGMPLAAYAKRMGKKGIHVGGALQLMFGIMGKRWEGSHITGMRPEYWVRPSEEETPHNKEIIEGGSYW
jgi:hypothetical protein